MPHLIAASMLASLLRDDLADGNEERATRTITEAIGRLLHLEGDAVPAEVLAEPPLIGIQRWDALMEAGFAYALNRSGIEPPMWTERTPPLKEEWAWGFEGASDELEELIREDTPPEFRKRGLLVRERAWTIR